MTWLHTDRQTERQTADTDALSLYDLVTHRRTDRPTYVTDTLSLYDLVTHRQRDRQTSVTDKLSLYDLVTHRQTDRQTAGGGDSHPFDQCFVTVDAGVGAGAETLIHLIRVLSL